MEKVLAYFLQTCQLNGQRGVKSQIKQKSSHCKPLRTSYTDIVISCYDISRKIHDCTPWSLLIHGCRISTEECDIKRISSEDALNTDKVAKVKVKVKENDQCFAFTLLSTPTIKCFSFSFPFLFFLVSPYLFICTAMLHFFFHTSRCDLSFCVLVDY